MSTLIRDAKALILTLMGVFALIGTLQFTVVLSNQLHDVAENPQEAPKIAEKIVEQGVKEIVDDIQIEVYLAVILAIFTAIGWLLARARL